MQKLWIDKGNYYVYSVKYPSQVKAFIACQRLMNKLKISAYTLREDDLSDNPVWRVITLNDVPHEEKKTS